MEKIKIGRIFVNKTNKEGKPLLTKTGKPYISVTIYPADRPGEKISGFAWQDTDPACQWKEGQEVNVVIEQKGQYINFRVPKREDLFEDRLSFLEQKVARIQSQLEKQEIHGTQSVIHPAIGEDGEGSDFGEEEINQVPF